jgi:predicted transposase/invertase (TIGR01784 family)
METYRNSVTEYDDVILAMDYAEERGKKQGIEIGEKKELIRLVQTIYKNGMSIDQLIKFTGLAKEQVFTIIAT